MNGKLFFHGRALPAALLALVVSGCFFGTPEIVVTSCVDQDNTPLAYSVEVTVDGETKVWQPGEEVAFDISGAEGGRNVEIYATTRDYVFNSRPVERAVDGETREIQIAFWRPYEVYIEALGNNDLPVPEADVFLEGEQLGQTDDRGVLFRLIDKPGLIRRGDTLRFTLQKRGRRVDTEIAVVERGRYTYNVAGVLPLAGVSAFADAGETEREATTEDRRSTASDTRSSTRDRRTEQQTSEERETAPPDDTRETVEDTQPDTRTVESNVDYIEVGNQAYVARRFAEAVNAYRKVPSPEAGTDQETYMNVLLRLGDSAVRTGDYRNAASAYRRMLTYNEQEAAAFLGLVVTYNASVKCDSLDHYADLIDQVKYTIRPPARQEYPLRAMFAAAECRFEMFRQASDATLKRRYGRIAEFEIDDFLRAVQSANGFEAEIRRAEQMAADIQAASQ